MKATQLGLVVVLAFSLVGCQTGEVDPEYALAMASSSGDMDKVQELIRHGADAGGEPSYKGYPLICALNSDELEIADVLVQNGADVNVRLTRGQSLLDRFIIYKNQAEDEVEEARYELAIDWLYENGARRRP